MPILRAGLGMLDGVLDMVPNAKISVVGLARDHETLQPVHYFEKFVGHLSERTALIVDPMLATAGSMIATIDLLKARGCQDIRALVLVAALAWSLRAREVGRSATFGAGFAAALGNRLNGRICDMEIDERSDNAMVSDLAPVFAALNQRPQEPH